MESETEKTVGVVYIVRGFDESHGWIAGAFTDKGMAEACAEQLYEEREFQLEHYMVTTVPLVVGGGSPVPGGHWEWTTTTPSVKVER